MPMRNAFLWERRWKSELSFRPGQFPIPNRPNSASLQWTISRSSAKFQPDLGKIFSLTTKKGSLAGLGRQIVYVLLKHRRNPILTSALTVKLWSNHIVTKFFCFLRTAADKSRHVDIPIEPVDRPSAIVAHRRISFVQDVVRQCPYNLQNETEI